MAGRLKQGLVAHWPLNGHTDDVVHGNDGTATGGTILYEEGPFGRSVWYKAGVEYINCGNSSILNLASELSMCCWISKVATVNIYALAKRDASGNNGYNIFISGTGSSLSVADGSGTIKLLSSGLDFTTSTPTHVVVTISGNNATLYINGEYVNSITITPFEYVPDTDLYLGNRTDGSYSGTYNLWGVRLYNIKLTAEEAKEIFIKSNNPPKPTSVSLPKSQRGPYDPSGS